MAGLVAVLPLFVVMAAQGQITEVNPSGVSGVKGTVSIPNPDDPNDPRVLTVDANTSWKVVGQEGKATGVVARFDFSASDQEGDGSPVYACNGVGGTLTSLVRVCLNELNGPNDDLDFPDELEDMITAFKDAAHNSLLAIGINEATYNTNTASGTTNDDG